MSNVAVIDEIVKILKDHKKAFIEKQYVPLSHKEVDVYITALERLRMMERHLLNLCSAAYEFEPPKPPKKPVTKPANKTEA